MASPHPVRRMLRFGPFELDTSAGQLFKSGIPIKLQPQPFRVLSLLIERAGEVVTREEIHQFLWGDSTFVDFERGINFSINQIRGALCDDPDKPRYVETIPRRGYRFIGRVVIRSDAEGTLGAPRAYGHVHEWPTESGSGLVITRPIGEGTLSQSPSASVFRKRKYLWAALGVAVLITAGVSWRWRSQPHVAPIRSLAVLPLENLSGDPAQDYFADGITDQLITSLGQISSLRVISHTSVNHYKGANKPVPQIVRELGVDGLVEGTVMRAGNRVRVTASLIQGSPERHLWANSYERDMRDVFALERDVTQDIARQIQARLTTKNRVEQAQPRPMDPKALEAYLQGNYHLNKQGKGFGDEEKKKAAEYFQQAIAADPNFAPAYHGLANAHELLWLGSSEDFAISRKAGEKAVEVDPNYSVARVNLAAIKWQPDLDWRGAEEDLRRAIALDNNSPFAHSALCILLVVLGHVDEGLQECRIAQRLDPFDDDAAQGLYMGRDYDGSIAMLRVLLQGDPDVGLSRCYLFQNYAMKGMYKESIQELEQCYSLFGQPEAAANIQRAFEASGYHGAIRQWAKEIEHLQATHQAFLPGSLAEAYTILGDKNRAFYWLEQAYGHREMVSFDDGVFYLGAEPMYDPLRSDPRFKDLLRRVGLPP
jgi:TolB-like protein/DNA-binding winged helix-turn-helix (wHTH) protein/Tfp pilus assembly protein PilF